MIPSAAPYSATWSTERQVATESPLIERVFFRLRFFYSAFFLRGWRLAKCSKQKDAVPNTAIMVSTIMPRVELSTLTSYAMMGYAITVETGRKLLNRPDAILTPPGLLLRTLYGALRLCR